jgi:hypothetical protein
MTPDDDDYQLRACARSRRFVLFAGETFSFPPRIKERREEKERKEKESDISPYTYTMIYIDID